MQKLYLFFTTFLTISELSYVCASRVIIDNVIAPIKYNASLHTEILDPRIINLPSCMINKSHSSAEPDIGKETSEQWRKEGSKNLAAGDENKEEINKVINATAIGAETLNLQFNMSDTLTLTNISGLELPKDVTNIILNYLPTKDICSLSIVAKVYKNLPNILHNQSTKNCRGFIEKKDLSKNMLNIDDAKQFILNLALSKRLRNSGTKNDHIISEDDYQKIFRFIYSEIIKNEYNSKAKFEEIFKLFVIPLNTESFWFKWADRVVADF